MPYLTPEDKDRVDRGFFPENAGQLNYLLTKTVIDYLLDKPELGKRINYDALNEVDGALDLCKAEFQRRIVFPYEDSKISKNGDVYDQLIDVIEVESDLHHAGSPWRS